MTKYEIEFSELQDRFEVSHNMEAYKEEIKRLKTVVGRSIDSETSMETMYLYRAISQALGFVSNGGKTIRL